MKDKIIVLQKHLLKVPELNVISSLNNKRKLLPGIHADCHFLLKFSFLSLQDRSKVY